MKKLILIVIPFLTINLMSTEIKLDGKYAYALGNPFKEKLEQKTKAVTLKNTGSTLLNFDVKSNINNNLLTRPTDFSIRENECQNILRKYLAEDFLIQENAKTTVSCKFLPSTITLDYHEDQHMTYMLRDVNIDVNVLLNVERNGKTLLSKPLNTKMNKDLGIKGDEYDWSIRYTFDFEHENLEDTVQKILEYSVFQMVSSELEDKKGSF